MTNMLSVAGIDVFYGELQALWKVSLDVQRGGFVTVIGSNGAGKSTLLRTISGLISPRSGSITLEDKAIHKLGPHKVVENGISLIPEGRMLFPRMSVRENLEVGAFTVKSKEHKKESLARVFSLFPRLKERENQLAGTLSGGEQQMLAIGRGLMSEPKLLMLDEPSLGLAPKSVILIFDVMKKIHDEGVTLLLVEQNVHQALSVAERAYLLETGRMVAEKPAQELLDDEGVRKKYLGM